MRKLVKGVKPQVLVDNDVNWTAELLAAAPGTADYKTKEERYRNDEIKDALRGETHKKCAYCESLIEGVSYSHIEHIYPKQSFPDQAFSWENLTLACQRCNTEKSIIPPTNLNFVHPYESEPQDRFRFLGAWMWATNGDAAASTMIGWLKLNRSQLLEERAETVALVEGIFQRAASMPIGQREDYIRFTVSAWTAAESQYSRVAECAAELFAIEFAGALAAP